MGKIKYAKYGIDSKSRDFLVLSNRLYGMKYRCYNPDCKNYKDYGGRGIFICDEWLNPTDGMINFYNWAINNGFDETLTIDRINVNEGYKPSNCRWITMFAQQANKRNNTNITINGETHHMSEWSRISGVNNSTITRRLNIGWDLEKCIQAVENEDTLFTCEIEGVTWNISRNRWKCMSTGMPQVFVGWYYTKEKATYAKIIYEDTKVRIHNSEITEEMLLNLPEMQEEYINNNTSYFKRGFICK